MISDPAHSTPAAVNGTVTLSSSLIAIVSARAAAAAATNGPPSENHGGGGMFSVGRHHHASDAPARPPHSHSAAVPATLFSRFHGIRGPLTIDPTIEAMPSPAARIAHAAATMSRRVGKTRIRMRIESGYRSMPAE